MSHAFKYRVFLSYSHADSVWARRLHRALENYRVPRQLTGAVAPADRRSKRLAPVFRDRDELASGSSLPSAINMALEASESLVVICSPGAAASRWVNEEILAFKRLGRSDRIFCFIVDGEPHAGDETECFPESVRYELTDSGDIVAVAAEPLAADARPQGDGYKVASLKLIAGLLGVGYDDLRQRQLQRRHQRMLAVTVSSLFISVLTITLAVLAYLSNAEAERRRAEAEDLIGFMLGDLRGALHEIGRLDVFMSVGDKAMEYFAAQADEDVNDHMLNQRAKALRQIGNVRMIQGETEMALESFRESLAIAKKLAARDPANADWQVALANSHFYVGWVHWQRDELDEAREEFEIVIPIVDAVSARDPGNASWLAERAYAYTNLGRILELEGQLEKALEIYEEVKRFNDRLVDLAPENIDYQLEIGFAHNNLGKLVESLGRLAEAEKHYREDLKIKQAISANHPAHNLWKQYLATSHSFLARTLTLQGHDAQSRKHFEAAIAIMTHLLTIDSESADWMEMLANYERALGAMDRRQGAWDAAGRRVRSSTISFTQLLQIDETVSWWQQGLAQCQVEAARLALLQGRPGEALEPSRSAVSAYERLLENEPRNLETQRLLAVGLLTLGEVLDSLGERNPAQLAWQKAMSLIEEHFAASSDPKIGDVSAALLTHLGKKEQAASVLENLRARSYQPGASL